MRGVQVFGEVIRSLRASKGLTQEELAKLADLDVTTLRKMERGKKAFDARSVASLAEVLDCHVTRLIVPQVLRAEPLSPEQAYFTCLARHRDGFLKKDVEQVLSCYAEDAVVEFPASICSPTSGLFDGYDAIRRHLEATFQTFTPQIPTLEESDLFVLENRVILRHIGSAEVLHNGATFTSDCLFEFWFRDGKICRHIALFDTAVLAQALNAPPRKTPPAES